MSRGSTGVGVGIGAGVGLLIGLLISDGTGIALGLTFGAGVGSAVGAAIDSRGIHHINSIREDDMTKHTTATVDEALRLGSGFREDERNSIIDGWASLDERLRSFDAGTVELELSVKERGEASQRTVLEAWISGQARVVATSSEPDLTNALREVRDDLVRQLTDAKSRAEPRNNPALRDTVRGER